MGCFRYLDLYPVPGIFIAKTVYIYYTMLLHSIIISVASVALYKKSGLVVHCRIVEPPGFFIARQADLKFEVERVRGKTLGPV